MFFRKTIAKLKAEIQYLREVLARTEGQRDEAQRINKELIESHKEVSQIARERGGILRAYDRSKTPDLEIPFDEISTDNYGEKANQKLYPDRLITFHCPKCSYQESVGQGERASLTTKCPECGYAGYIPNYNAPEAKNCPECLVSVRPESWPAECPACHIVFGFPDI